MQPIDQENALSVKSETSEMHVSATKQESMDSVPRCHKDHRGEVKEESEDEDVDLDTLMNNLNKLKKQIDKCRKRQKIE